MEAIAHFLSRTIPGFAQWPEFSAVSPADAAGERVLSGAHSGLPARVQLGGAKDRCPYAGSPRPDAGRRLARMGPVYRRWSQDALEGRHYSQ